MVGPKALFVMADYGHDPTETAVPYSEFQKAGFEVYFATEKGKSPECDERMLRGLTQKLLGADQKAVKLYDTMKRDPRVEKPVAWTDPAFSLDSYDLLFFPGGHEKGVRQVIDSTDLHKKLAAYFPLTRKPSRKSVAAICHGVMAVAEAKLPDGKSVMHDATTTALPGFMEGSIFWATRLWLGDYYKTYGACSDSVETSVRKQLDDPEKQYRNSLGMTPFIREDETYNYVSGRFPPDAQLLAQKSVAMVQRALQ